MKIFDRYKQVINIKQQIIQMSYFSGIFTTQYHKSKSGYFLNHDILMSISPAARNKLIFYFIAEQVPQKLTPADQNLYEEERNSRIRTPITLWTWTTFAALFVPCAVGIVKKRRLTVVRDLFLWGAASGYGATVVNSTLWRVYEGRVVESSEIIDKLANKYNFGIYDFSLAKKESHVKKLLEVYDCNREILHDRA